MPMRVAVTAALALCASGAALAADPDSTPLRPPAPLVDTAKSDGGTGPTTDAAPPANSGQLEVQPGPQPQKPTQPPNLNIPSRPAAPSQPGRTGPENQPPNESIEQHQEPPPKGQAPDELPRGEGAAMIPKETPSGIKAIEDWFLSWFE